MIVIEVLNTRTRNSTTVQFRFSLIQVERRRDQRSDVFDRLAARFAATYSCMTNYNPCTALDDGTFDRQEPEKWDWKRLLKVHYVYTMTHWIS